VHRMLDARQVDEAAASECTNMARHSWLEKMKCVE